MYKISFNYKNNTVDFENNIAQYLYRDVLTW